MTKSYLVTGAQGFVGRYMVSQLLRDSSARVVGIGRSQGSSLNFTHYVVLHGMEQAAPLTPELLADACNPRYTYRPVDIADLAGMIRVISEFEPEIVIHLASTRREEGPERLIEGNVQGLRVLVEACAASGSRVRRIVLGSTGGVYGIPIELPLTETAHCTPADAYAASKLAGEHFARVLCRDAEIDLVIGRIFNVVGPGQEERHLCGRLASQLAGIVQGHRRPVLSVGMLSPTRDFIDVRDVAVGLHALARNGVAGEIYNVGSGVETSVREVVNSLIEAADLAGRVEIDGQLSSQPQVMRHFADSKKAKRMGIHNAVDLRTSLTDLLCYYSGQHSTG